MKENRSPPRWLREALSVAIVFIAISGSIRWVFSNFGTPPSARTGAPGELTCYAAGCHSSASVANPSSDIALSVPSSYTPGQSYSLTFTISNDAAGSNGFEVTAQRTSDNGYAAAWSNQGSGSQIDTSWWKHNSAGSQTSFTVTWTAPAANTGTVRFYAIANKGGSAPAGNFHQKTFDVTEATPPPAPSISSLSPSFGSLDTSVTIAGSDFGATASTVNFANGTSTATVSSWSDASIVAKATGSAGGNVTVTNANGTSNGKAFALITAAPAISSATPAFADRAAGSVTIGLSGTNFSPQASVALSTDTAGLPISSAAATGVTVGTTTQATGVTFNLSGMATGYWTLTLTNPDGKSGSLVNGLLVQVKPDAPANLQAVALSSAAVRWSWTNAGDNVGGLRLLSSTGGVMTPDLPAGTVSYDEHGYAPNALAVRAVESFNVVGSSDSASVSTATFANAPVAAATPFTAIAADALTAAWGADGNVSGTLYDAVVSTATPLVLTHAGNVTVSTSPSGTPSAAFASLRPNTTYFAFARAVNRNGAATAYAALGSTATLANPLTVSSATVHISSIVVSWSHNGNPTDTSYFGQVSTDAFVTIKASPSLSGTSGLVPSLDPNTTYYLRLRAVNRNNVPTDYSTFAPTATRAAAPASAPPANVTATVATANWGSNNNGPATLYEAQVSTDAFATVKASSLTLNTSATFSGLPANTAHSFRVRARGHGGDLTPFTALPSTTTLLAAPAAAATTFPAVELSSIAVQWAGGGNGPGTAYVAQVSTDDFASVNASSSTLNLSALFGAGGAGASLAPNSTYYFRVQSSNGANTSAFLTLGSTFTLAAVPSQTAVLSVSSTSASLDWQPGGNPEPGTRYELWRDVSGSFPSPVKTAVSTSAASAAGLLSNTTYFFKVRALNLAGIPSAFDSSVSTLTFPPGTGKPGRPAGTALGVSSISWTWAAASDAAGYNVYPASNPASLAGSVPTPPFLHTGLSTNTAYGLVVAGTNVGGAGPLSDSATVYTLAAPPSGTAASLVAATSATISWSLNGNPASTSAEVQRSTDNASFSAAFSGAATSMTDFGLIGCTTYYFRVRNRNGDGIVTAFDGPVQFLTLASTPAAPIGLSAESQTGNRIDLSWTASPTEGITGYRLYYDAGTGVVSFAAPLAVLSSTQTSFTTGVLASSAAYVFALRARHRCGLEETTGVLASAASAASLASVRAAVRAPEAGRRVSGNRVSVVAELASGALADVRTITFQYKSSASTGWLNVPAAAAEHPNPDSSAPYYIQWDVTGLAPGNYDLRAVALGISGSSDTAPGAVTVAVDPINPDISESLVGGKIQKQQVVNNAVANTIRASGAAADDPSAKIILPAGALSASTVTVTVVSNPLITTSPPSGFSAVGSAVRIGLSNAQSQLSGGLTAGLTLSYPGSVTVPSLLQIYSLNEATGAWSKDFASTVDTANRTVSGNTPHFSVFALLSGSPTAADLSSVRVYPVPYKPNNANPDDGKPYSAGDTTSGIIFDNLPASASIKIYTLSGRLVATFQVSSGAGAVRWDARNSDGRDAASGGYFAVITAPGQKSVVKRLAILR